MSSSVSLEYLNSVLPSGGNIGFTADGGLFITLINNTGTSVRGTIVSACTTTDNCAMTAPANSMMPIGVVVDSGIAAGQLVRVAISGKAYVLLKNGQAASRGMWAGVSDNAGRMYQQTDPPGSSSSHASEIGHSLETKSSGTNVLALVDLHFN